MAEVGPWGAELGRCWDQYCTDEDPEILDFYTDYNIFEGWYILRTTADCYDVNGDLREELDSWLDTVLCFLDPETECPETTDPNEIVYIYPLPDSSSPNHFFIMKTYFEYNGVYNTLGYCPNKCVDMGNMGPGDDPLAAYDGSPYLTEF